MEEGGVMAEALYQFSITNDFPKQKVSQDKLFVELAGSSISIALISVTVIDDTVDVRFMDTLETTDQQTLNQVVAAHDGEPLQKAPDEVNVNWEDKDKDGRPFTRLAITEKGWTFLAHFIEAETSVLNSIYCEDHTRTVEAQHYCKFYDVNGVELTSQAAIDTSCVKSVFTIIPGIDFEVVAGEIHQFERPTTNMRLHSIIGVIAPNGAPIATTEFVRNLNMKFKDKAKAIVTDGRAPKRLNKTVEGVPYDANQLQIVVNHDAGVKHQFMIELEYYRQ